MKSALASVLLLLSLVAADLHGIDIRQKNNGDGNGDKPNKHKPKDPYKCEYESLKHTPTCVDGVYMIFARGSRELPGPGRIGYKLGPKIIDAIPGSAGVALPYPAQIPSYNFSVHCGMTTMQKMVMDYVDHCGPNHVVALFGYSQGGQVVGDTLCGSLEKNVPPTPGLAPKYDRQILAAIQMGDPTYIPDVPWDYGNASHKGIFPRLDAMKECRPYTSPERLRSYCDAFDAVCASGTSVIVHLSYLQVYHQNALDFITSRWEYFKKNGVTYPHASGGGGGNGGGDGGGDGGNGGGDGGDGGGDGGGGHGSNDASSILSGSSIALWLLASVAAFLTL